MLFLTSPAIVLPVPPVQLGPLGNATAPGLFLETGSFHILPWLTVLSELPEWVGIQESAPETEIPSFLDF
jgi:hypothetical protein